MKSGLAVMQLLFESLDLASLPYALVLVFYDREEGPYGNNGLQRVLDTYDHLRGIDIAVVLEPTNNTFGRPVVWSHPAFAQRCLFARNDRELVCVDLAAP